MVEVYSEGKELIHRVRIVLEDGKIELKELIWLGHQLVVFIRLEAVQRTGNWFVRTWRKLFGK